MFILHAFTIILHMFLSTDTVWHVLKLSIYDHVHSSVNCLFHAKNDLYSIFLKVRALLFVLNSIMNFMMQFHRVWGFPTLSPNFQPPTGFPHIITIV